MVAKKLYRITEYGSFTRDKIYDGYKSLPSSDFEALKKFVLENAGVGNDGADLMGLSVRKNIGEVLTTKNYVGVIELKNGSVIEILPKIYGVENYDNEKKLLINMLKTLRNTPFKSLQSSNVDVTKMPIFEIFIRMFITEVYGIVKRGLKSGYERIDDNISVCKGKINFKDQIKYNCAHKERFCVSYDEFNNNQPENKLVKSTLKYLFNLSRSFKNKADLKVLINTFESVDESSNVDADFAKCSSDRNSKHYDTVLMWCKVFLKGKSFVSFSGSDVAYALLFPMEKLFESYVATKLKKKLDYSEYSISIQNTGKYLYDEPKKKFALRPDIVITRKSDNAIFVMDTKWKKLYNNPNNNYGISQADMYQMFAYQKKYDCKNVTLIYPLVDEMIDTSDIVFKTDGESVYVRFVDLMNIDDSLSLIEQIYSEF